MEFNGPDFEQTLSSVFSEVLGISLKPLKQYEDIINRTHYSEKNK